MKNAGFGLAMLLLVGANLGPFGVLNPHPTVRRFT
jgi:hypothetical protein